MQEGATGTREGVDGDLQATRSCGADTDSLVELKKRVGLTGGVSIIMGIIIGELTHPAFKSQVFGSERALVRKSDEEASDTNSLLPDSTERIYRLAECSR